MTIKLKLTNLINLVSYKQRFLPDQLRDYLFFDKTVDNTKNFQLHYKENEFNFVENVIDTKPNLKFCYGLFTIAFMLIFIFLWTNQTYGNHK